MKDKKLKFAEDYRHWTSKGWSKVLVRDESSIQQFVVRRPIGKRFDSKYTVATMKHPSQLNDLEGHVKQRHCRIVFFDSWNHNEWKKYLDLLKDKLKMHININESKIFMHDGAPCHKANW